MLYKLILFFEKFFERPGILREVLVVSLSILGRCWGSVWFESILLFFLGDLKLYVLLFRLLLSFFPLLNILNKPAHTSVLRLLKLVGTCAVFLGWNLLTFLLIIFEQGMSVKFRCTIQTPFLTKQWCPNLLIIHSVLLSQPITLMVALADGCLDFLLKSPHSLHHSAGWP